MREYPTQLRGLPDHARELPIRGVDAAVKNEKREGEDLETLVVEQSAAGGVTLRRGKLILTLPGPLCTV